MASIVIAKALIYGLNDRIVILQNNAWQTQKTAIKTYIDHKVLKYFLSKAIGR